MPSPKQCPTKWSVQTISRRTYKILATKPSADSLCAGSATNQLGISIQGFPAVPPPQRGVIPPATLLYLTTVAHAAELDACLGT